MDVTLSASTPLAERAKALVPLLDTYAPYGDEHSLLAPEVIDAYNEAGLLKMWVPEDLGGFELGPLDSLEVLALTSYGDPSAGWVQMAASLAIGTAGSYLGETAVKELFGNGRCPVIAGQGTAPGREYRDRTPSETALRIYTRSCHHKPLARTWAHRFLCPCRCSAADTYGW